MNKSIVVGALIIAIAVILASAMHIYFSPYWSCVRASQRNHEKAGEETCAMFTGGR